MECRGASPDARENNGVVVRNNKLILFGGYSGSSWLNDMYEFDLGAWRPFRNASFAPPLTARSAETSEWTELSPKGTPPSPRFGYVSAVHKDRFVLFAGYDGSTWLQDLHEYNFSACAGAWAGACGRADGRARSRGLRALAHPPRSQPRMSGNRSRRPARCRPSAVARRGRHATAASTCSAATTASSG